MTSPEAYLPHDTSRFVMMSSRFETPQFLVDEFRQMFRETFGDDVADAMEASIPPPWGTHEPR